MIRSKALAGFFALPAMLASTLALGQDSFREFDHAIELRSRWVCVANIKRGSVYGYGDTLEEARSSVLRRCFPNSLCLEHMTCRERTK